MKNILKISAEFLIKSLLSLILIALIAIFATSVTPIYQFREAEPFKGPDIFNPYRKFDSNKEWKRANFHTHTRVEGILNECEYWPADVLKAYQKFDYSIVTFSNHNEITQHPTDYRLHVSLYEHGYNLFKYHKLVFGAKSTDGFDHLLPIFTSQKQYQLERLSSQSDFIQFNHPLRTNLLTKRDMELLEGYEIMELDSGKSTENEYWDWALSAGRYSFGLANDDLHYPDRSNAIAVRCNFIQTDSEEYTSLKQSLLEGCYYAMRVPDYGKGDWEEKYARNRQLPKIDNIGVKEGDIYIKLSHKADSIRVIGQNHTTLHLIECSDTLGYRMLADDSYARIVAYFKDGEVIYTNPFARYDSSISETPFVEPSFKILPIQTILFNLICLLFAASVVFLLYKLVVKWRIFARKS